MGNGALWMEEDQCIFKDICRKNTKRWCNDFKILEESNCVCSIFENIIEMSHRYLIEKIKEGG